MALERGELHAEEHHNTNPASYITKKCLKKNGEKIIKCVATNLVVCDSSPYKHLCRDG
jgi:hypothetical protein